MAAKPAPAPEAADLSGSRRYIAAAIIVVGIIGGLATAVRPVIRQKYAVNALTAQQILDRKKTALVKGNVNAVLSAEDQARLVTMLSRLRELQQAHRARHPTWYGEPDAATLEYAVRHAADIESSAAVAFMAKSPSPIKPPPPAMK